jgi:outer membrane protein assembly factor BamB
MLAGLALGALLLLPANAPVAPKAPNPVLAAASGAWTVYHHDNGHSANDPSLGTVSSVSTGWTSATLDDEVYAEPLIYNGLVYTATLNNTVYAIDQATGLTAWTQNLGTPQGGGWVCGNVAPMGILGTPVIDTAASRIYVVAEIANVTLGGPPTYRLFGLDLGTGTPVLNTVIAPTGFDWSIQQQRGALALANGYVYIPFGGRAGDCFNGGTPYYGWVVAAPTNGTAPIWFKTPSGAESVWAAGGVVVDDTSHNIFFATGNAIPCAGATLSDSIVRLSPTLGSMNFFEPVDWQANWCGPDSDLGSASPLLISPNLMFTAGKHGGGFLLDPTNLGGINGQVFPNPAAYAQANVCFGNTLDATFASFAYAAPFVYVSCEGGPNNLLHGLVAINVNTSARTFSPCNAACAAPDWHVGGATVFGPPIVAGGAVWVANDGGGLYAFNASTGAQIFQSAGFRVNRFVTPSEAGGQVFVPSRNVIRSFNMNLAWNRVGGYITSGPDASSWGPTRTDVFVRGSEGGLWQATWNGSAWSWTFLGGLINADPSAVSWGANRVDVFARGNDNALWHRSSDGVTWADWEKLGGVITSGPDAVSTGSGSLDVFVRGTEGGLWRVSWNGTTWTWSFVGGRITSAPGGVASGTNRIDVFVRGTENGLWQTTWNGTTWSWNFLGGVISSSPDAASCTAGHLDVFALGTENGLWQLGFNGTTWGPWQFIGSQWSASPSAVCPTGTSSVSLFERGTDGALWQSTVPGS